LAAGRINTAYQQYIERLERELPHYQVVLNVEVDGPPVLAREEEGEGDAALLHNPAHARPPALLVNGQLFHKRLMDVQTAIQ